VKTLIVEDDFTSRLLMQEMLGKWGPAHIAVNGKEAVKAVLISHASRDPYDLICMDIMMPEMGGQEALREIRKVEESVGVLSTKGAKIIMTTSLGDMKNVMQAFDGLCDAYIEKPIKAMELFEELKRLSLL
jgi:two-component system, chemotaxis family, chemotaxis protein CheY